jgi:hypothetical protein
METATHPCRNGCHHPFVWENKARREREREREEKAVRDSERLYLRGWGKRNVVSGFEGSQAEPVRPSVTGMYERGQSFSKRIGMKPGFYCA